jgi:hypothetical protein
MTKHDHLVQPDNGKSRTTHGFLEGSPLEVQQTLEKPGP